MINLFVKGFFIGIGKILPGVSGSLLAISFGIYDKVLEIISHPFKNLKNNIIFLFPICIGFLLAIIITSNFLEYLLLKYYTIVMLIFISLIISSIFDLKKEIKFNMKSLIIILVSFLLVFSLNFITNNNQNINYSFIIILIIGLIEAATTIIPGISGTAIFMIIGCYDFILLLFSNCYSVVYLKYTIPFILGFIIGFILISKIINYLLHNYKNTIYSLIMGFTIGSIVLLILRLRIDNLYSLIVGIMSFILFRRLTKK